jgi:hypothetical protein
MIVASVTLVQATQAHAFHCERRFLVDFYNSSREA